MDVIKRNKAEFITALNNSVSLHCLKPKKIWNFRKYLNKNRKMIWYNTGNIHVSSVCSNFKAFRTVLYHSWICNSNQTKVETSSKRIKEFVVIRFKKTKKPKKKTDVEVTDDDSILAIRIRHSSYDSKHRETLHPSFIP